MKYYYPTTTLNFDSMLSAQMISPPCMYKPDTLWWNRHEAIVGERSDALVFYNKCPVWTINDINRDNYPMVLELEKSFAKVEAVECVVDKALKLKATCVFESITFSMLEMLQGKVRFLFRNKTEMERMLTRAITSVGECKIATAARIDCPDVFDIIPTAKSKVFELESVLGVIANAFRNRPINEVVTFGVSEVRAERVRGAELGYRAGRNAKFLRTGCYLDGYREPISYEDWKKKVLPEPFSALIDKLCSRPLVAWDPNRLAIAQFCKECWFDCFNGKKVDGKVVAEGTRIHESLQSLARHWLSPEEEYRISAVQNPYMQAFAAFLECGNNAGKYPRFAKEMLLKQPEYLLTLYGALVGYTSFSRILLDNKVYLPSQPNIDERKDARQIPRRGGAPYVQQESGSVSSKFGVPKREGQNQAKELLIGIEKTATIASTSKNNSIIQPSLFDSSDHTLECNPPLLVCDAGLSAAIEGEFTDFGHERIIQLLHEVRRFSDEYTNGYYGRFPDRYVRANPEIINHMMNCFASPGIAHLEFKWRAGEYDRFVSFLENRYQCKRRVCGEV